MGDTTDTDQTSSGGRRVSRHLLALSVVLTLVVVVAGSALLIDLYEASFATPSPVAETVRPLGEPIVVGLGRSPGGPSEWITVVRAFSKVQRDLGRPVVLHYALDQSQQMSLLANDEIDLALTSVHGYLHSSAEDTLTIIAGAAIEGNPVDHAVLVVSARSHVRTLADLHGKSIVLSPDLVSEPYAKWLLSRHGEDLDFFGSVTRVHAQDVALTYVANGSADATCVRRSSLSSWPRGHFVVLAQSPRFGPAPIVASSHIDSETIGLVRRSLLSFSPAGGRQPSAISGFHVPAPADYDFARALDVFAHPRAGEARGIR